MRPLLISLAVLVAGCGTAQTGTSDSPASRRVTTDIETGEGITYSVTQTVDRSVVDSTVDSSPEAAWKLLPEVYRDLGVPVTLVDPRNRLLGTTDNRLRRIGTSRPSRYLECGSGPAGQYANVYQVHVSVVTQLQPSEGGGTRVSTELEAAARDPAHSNSALRCTSKGVLEKEIVEALQARIAGAAG